MTGAKIEGVSSELILGEEGTRSLLVYFSRSNVIEADGDVDATASASLNLSENRLAGTSHFWKNRVAAMKS